MATYLEQSLEMLREFEGSIPWMYLDTAGNVTVGTGAMLAGIARAVLLPFLVGSERASPEQITAEFERVRGMARGLRPEAYRRGGSPELAAEAMEAELLTTLEGFEADLRRQLRGYDGLPGPVKLALLDMAFNLGAEGLFEGYPKMLAAIAAGRWTAAAAQCARRGISAERNAWTRVQLLSAAAQAGVAAAIRAMAAGSRGVLRWGVAAGGAGLLAWGDLGSVAFQ